MHRMNYLLRTTVAWSAIAIVVVALFISTLVYASNHVLLLSPFTATELDENWEADRQFPSGGVESVSAFGRADVARLGIDSDETDPNVFRRTEGIKTVGEQNFGTAVEVDLYVDPEWEDTAVRAGFWVVGDNGAGERDNWFGIVEFVNLSTTTSGISAQANHEGWRYWDSIAGWAEVDTPVVYGEWTTLRIELDPVEEEYHYFVDDEQIGTVSGGQNYIRELFLNSYNYGEDVFEDLGSESYAAHWHAGLAEDEDPIAEDPETFWDCMGDNWQQYGFRNLGQCVRFALTGQDSR
jgi:hypothetical protein